MEEIKGKGPENHDVEQADFGFDYADQSNFRSAKEWEDFLTNDIIKNNLIKRGFKKPSKI